MKGIINKVIAILKFKRYNAYKMKYEGVQFMYELPHVANCILKRAFEEDSPITPMKLQKLLYFTYKAFLKKHNKTLFSERFEPWQYGPVLTDAYNAFKKYGSSPIREYFPDTNGQLRVVSLSQCPDLKECLDDVWDKYSGCTGIQLSKITHRSDGAWMSAIKKSSSVINDEDIKREPDIH